MVSSLKFQCVNPCKKSFGTRRGLTKHQDSCTIYNEVTGADLFASVEMEESANKRAKVSLDQLHNVNNFRDARAIVDLDPMDLDASYENEQLPCSQADLPASDAQSHILPETAIEDGPIVIEELGRGKRKKWKTRRYMDPRPEPPAPLPEPQQPDATSPDLPVENLLDICVTAKNANGVYREYASRPTYIPDEWCFDQASHPDHDEQVHDPSTCEDDILAATSPADLDKRSKQPSEALRIGTPQALKQQSVSWFAPFLSATTFRLLNWFWGTSSSKTLADLQTLADDVLKAKDFKVEDLAKFSVRLEHLRLDDWANNVKDSSTFLSPRDGWVQSSVDILLPTRTRQSSESSIPRFTVPGLHYRPIVEVIKAVFQSEAALRFHYTPFKQFWQQNDEEAPDRIYDELYSADAWLRMHADVQKLPRSSDDRYERVIAGLMFWSDSTHLTNFGNACLWPLYLYFGNQSKYERAKPSSHSCHHLAYFPKLPDNITDAYRRIGDGKPPTDATITHCKRELMHSLLATIFDDKFQQSCAEGILIPCFDGIVRRIFPRVLTYSADYPEKVLLSTIKFLSTYPCPRCLIKKSEAHRLGSPKNEATVRNQQRFDSHPQQVDIQYARSFIYREGRGVKSAAVEAVLSSKSLVPTSNALSKVIFALGYNFYQIFVVDFLHEIELGVWKIVLVHLIRILSVCGPETIILLNERYRLVSTFGPDTIRKFTHDASTLKKMAARDYEDLLLCSMPVFEGLFPEPHDFIVQRLLLALLNWHALGKLRSHTEKTLQWLESAKRELGLALEGFQNTTCQAYETRELPSERLRRERREARAVARKTTNGRPEDASAQDRSGGTTECELQMENHHAKTASEKGKEKEVKASKRKHFNLNTYKAHAPEHYALDIREYGTVDSYSTQIGELQHRAVKNYYSRTNKYLPVQQITKIERREYALRLIAAKDPSSKLKKSGTTKSSYKKSTSSVSKGCEEHHHMSNSRNVSMYLHTWLREHIYDPATKSFQRKLKNHILKRLLNTCWNEDTHADSNFTDADRNTVTIEYDRLYVHKVLRVNYTTYDGQRKQDSMNPRTHADVMVMAQEGQDCAEETHPYSYARIIGVFHAFVRHTGRQSTTEAMPVKVEFLWVRWFGRVTSTPSHRSSSNRLNTLAFVSAAEDHAFGFLEPSQVIRGVHLIPAFLYGKTKVLLCQSIARRPSDEDEDWSYYYVNSFVDRDMYMRFNGGGVGHTLLHLKNSSAEAFTPEVEGGLFTVGGSSNHLADSSNNEDQGRIVFDIHNDEVRSIDDDREEELEDRDEELESDIPATSDEEEEED